MLSTIVEIFFEYAQPNTSVDPGGKISLVQYLVLKFSCRFLLTGIIICALCIGSFNYYKIFISTIVVTILQMRKDSKW